METSKAPTSSTFVMNRLPPLVFPPPSSSHPRVIPPPTAHEIMQIFHGCPPRGPPSSTRYFAHQEKEFLTRQDHAKASMPLSERQELPLRGSQSLPSHRYEHRGYSPTSPVPSSPSSTSATLSTCSSSSCTSSRRGSHQEFIDSPEASQLTPSLSNDFATNTTGIAYFPSSTVYIEVPPAQPDDAKSPFYLSLSEKERRRAVAAERKLNGFVDRVDSMTIDVINPTQEESGISQGDAGRGFGVLMPPSGFSIRMAKDSISNTTCEGQLQQPFRHPQMTFIPLKKKGSGTPSRGPTRRSKKI